MLEESRSEKRGARNSACRNRSRAESRFASTMFIGGSSAGEPLERPANRLVGARPHHLAPFVAGREEAFLHVGLELARERRAEVAAMMQPVVGAHRAQHLGHGVGA